MTGDIVINIAANTAQVMQALRGLQAQAKQLAGALKAALTSYLSFSGIRTAISAAEDFERAFRRAMSIAMDLTPALRQQAREAVLEAAQATKFTADQAAAALYELISAGLKTEAALRALPAALQYAQAAGIEPGVGVKQIAVTLSALGLLGKTAEETGQNFRAMADIIAHASRLATTTAEEFGEALMTHAAPIARAVGQSVYELAGALTFLAANYRSGSEAGTMYRMVLMNIIDGSQKNAEAWKRLGVAVWDAQGNMRPLSQIMADLGAKLAQLSPEARLAALNMLGFNDRVIAVVSTMALNSQQLQNFTAAMRQAGGAAAQMAQEQMTPLQQMWAQFQVSLVKLGEGFTSILVALQPAVTLLGNMLAVVGGLLQNWAPLVAGIITFVVVCRGVPAIIALVVRALRTMAAASAAVQAIVAGPAGLTKVLAGLAAAAGVYVAVDQAFSAIVQTAESQAEAAEKAQSQFAGLTAEIQRTTKAAQQFSLAGQQAVKVIEDWHWETAAVGKEAVQFLEQAQRPTEAQQTLDVIKRLQLALANLDAAGRTWVLPGVQTSAEQLQQAIAAAGRQLDKQLGGLRERTAQLQLEIQLRRQGLGDLDIEAEKYRQMRRELGLAAEDVDRWLALEKEKAALIEAERQKEEQQRRAEQIRESLLTPLEEFERRLQEVLNLWYQGLLSAADVQRWVASEQEKIASQLGRGPTGAERAAAIQRYSAEAYSTILRSRLEQATKRENANERTARNTQQMLARLEQIQRVLERQEAL